MDAVMGVTKSKAPMSIVSSMLQLSAQTTCERVVLALKSKLIKKGRDTLGAPKGKKVRRSCARIHEKDSQNVSANRLTCIVIYNPLFH